MPPLRERAGDIPVLVRHFLGRYGAPVAITGCSDEAMAILAAFDYPGNVRQLEHLVQRAVAVAQPPIMQAADLPEEITQPAAPPPAAEGTVVAARQRAERERIVATLAKHRGEVTAAAKELQISRTTMWRLMKKHGIDS